MEEIRCQVCGEHSGIYWGEESGYKARYCQECEFVFVSPRPSLSDISEAAKTGVHLLDGRSTNVVKLGGFRKAKKKMFESRLRAILGRSFFRGKRWLDIGAGYGELLAAVESLAEGDGLFVGLEPNSPKVGASPSNVEIQNKFLSTIDDKYDCVCCINVISHVPSIDEFFAQVGKTLTDNGTFILVTGNGGAIPRSEYPDALYFPDHLHFLSEKALRLLLERNGFSIRTIERYRNFLPQNGLERFIKGFIKKMLGIPVTSEVNNGRFRSLWLICEKTEIN